MSYARSRGSFTSTSGSVRVAGIPVGDRRALAPEIGYLPEEPPLYEEFTAREQLEYVADLRELPPGVAGERIEAALDRFDLAGDADRRISGYSKGMRQKTAFIQSTLHEPAVLFALVHAPASTVPGDASLAGMLAVWGLAGGLLGVAYVLTGRLAAPVGGHFAFDLAGNNLLFAPSGAGLALPTVVRTTVEGPALFHPIEGLPMVVALLVGYALAGGWWLVRRRDGATTRSAAGA